MVRASAHLAGLCVASAACVGAVFVGCAFETGGLGASGAASSGASTAASSGAGGHAGAVASSTSAAGTGAVGTGGTGVTVGVGGGTDAGPDAAPVEAGPTAYGSCLEWLVAHPYASSGVYNLLDGMGDVYPAYCEMAAGSGGAGNAGDAGPPGGWTLVFKIDGTKSTFPYADALWINTTAYNANLPDYDGYEAKLASFWSVAFSELRVGMVDGGVTRWLIVPVGGKSLLDAVGQGAVTTLGRGAWEGLLAKGSLQTNCNWEGINAKGRVRIGIVGDESGDCATNPSPDSFIGFGADPSFQSPSPDCGNIARDNDDNGDQSTMTFGYVMVR